MCTIRRLAVFALAACAVIASRPGSAETRWTRVGPDGGAGFLSLAAAPSSPDVVYAGNRDSLFRSDDFGETWREVSPDRSAGIRRITVHPRDAETLLAQSLDYSLRRSEDGGVTWVAAAAPQDPDRPLVLERLAFDSAAVAYGFQDDREPGLVGIVRSDDGGATWSTCGELPDRFIERYSPIVDPRRPGRLLVVASRGLWRSIDGCATWTEVPGEPIGPGAEIEALAFGDAAGELWAARRFTRTLYRSTDGGATWAFVYDTKGFEIDELVVDPMVPERLYARAGPKLHVTEDDGASWRVSTSQRAPAPALVYPSRVIAPRGVAGRLLVKTVRGVERSFDAGRTWELARRGLVTTAGFQRVRFHPLRPNELWAAGFGGLARSRDSGRTWDWVDLGPEAPLEMTDVRIDPRDGMIYAAGVRRAMVVSEDDGATWKLVETPVQYAQPYRLAVDPHQPGRVVATTYFSFSPTLIEYDDRGAVVRTQDAPSHTVEIFFDPQTPGRMVYSTDIGIFVQDGFDEPWRWTWRGDHVGLLATTPAAPRRLWTLDKDTGHLWRSDDFGETWTESVGDLAQLIGVPSHLIESISPSPHDPDDVTVGVFTLSTPATWRTDDGGLSWRSVDTPGNHFVGQILVSPDESRVAWYSTSGFGLLRREDRPLPECVDDQGLCLRSGRFEVIVDWRDAAGNAGRARRVVDDIDTSGVFWFFDEENWEAMVKVLDGCAINDRFWVLAAATTDVDLTMRVEDRWSGLSRTYVDPLGRPAKARIDNDAFATCDVVPPDGADTSPPTAASGDLGPSVDLVAGRYRVSVEWTTGGTSGVGRAAPLRTEDSALFWFFDPSNWEMLVKVLDGCAINGHRWVLAGISSDVGYALRVEDTVTGAVRVFEHAPGTPAPALVEIEAFACE